MLPIGKCPRWIPIGNRVQFCMVVRGWCPLVITLGATRPMRCGRVWRILPRRIRVLRSADLKTSYRGPKGQNGTFWVGRVSSPKPDQNGRGNVLTCSDMSEMHSCDIWGDFIFLVKNRNFDENCVRGKRLSQGKLGILKMWIFQVSARSGWDRPK